MKDVVSKNKITEVKITDGDSTMIFKRHIAFLFNEDGNVTGRSIGINRLKELLLNDLKKATSSGSGPGIQQKPLP